MAKRSRYEIIKAYYDSGRWTLAMVYASVGRGYITAEQFKKITGHDYEKVGPGGTIIEGTGENSAE